MVKIPIPLTGNQVMCAKPNVAGKYKLEPDAWTRCTKPPLPGERDNDELLARRFDHCDYMSSVLARLETRARCSRLTG